MSASFSEIHAETFHSRLAGLVGDVAPTVERYIAGSLGQETYEAACRIRTLGAEADAALATVPVDSVTESSFDLPKTPVDDLIPSEDVIDAAHAYAHEHLEQMQRINTLVAINSDYLLVFEDFDDKSIEVSYNVSDFGRIYLRLSTFGDSVSATAHAEAGSERIDVSALVDIGTLNIFERYIHDALHQFVNPIRRSSVSAQEIEY